MGRECEDRHRRSGSKAIDRVVAVPGARGDSRRGCAKGVEHRNDFAGGGIGELSASWWKALAVVPGHFSQWPSIRRGAFPRACPIRRGRTEDGVSGLAWPARIEGRSRPYGPGHARQAASDSQSAEPMHRVRRGAQQQSLHRGKEPRLKSERVPSPMTGTNGRMTRLQLRRARNFNSRTSYA